MKIARLFSWFMFGVLCTGPVMAQSDIRQILSTAVYYDETVAAADEWFAARYPGWTANELCSGPMADGEYVQYMRWKAYWKDQLNPDGSLGDPTAFFRRNPAGERGGSGMYEDVPWTNLSYSNYITMQIGLGRTTCIGFHPTDPNTFYVGAAIGGVWKTENGGDTYTPIGDELPFLAVSSIVVNQDDPSILYIAISDHVSYGPPSIGVYKSVDGGETWNPTALEFSFSENVRIMAMMADPDNPERIFVASSDGLYRSDDGFETVVQVNALNCSDIRFKPGDAQVVYLGLSGGTLYKSTDGGESFTSAGGVGSSSCFIAVTDLDPERVYIRSGGIMKRSYDSGETLGAAVNLPESGCVIIFSPDDVNTIIAGNFEVYKSVNDGVSFYPITQWLGEDGLDLIHVDQRNIFVNPLVDDQVYLCNDGGLYALHILGESFTNYCSGLHITQFYDIAVSQTDENVIGGGSQDNGNVFRGSNGVWNDYAGTGDGMNQEVDWTNSEVRYWEYQLGSLYRYWDGNNVSISPSGQGGNGSWETPFRLDHNDPDAIVVAYKKVYQSWNKGSTWTAISDDLDGSSTLDHIALCPSNATRMYAARGNKLWVRQLFTEEWDQKVLPGSSISDIEVDPVDMDKIYVTVPGFTDGQKVFRSTDAGSTWENISGSLPNVSTGAIEIYKLVSGGLFVGTDAGVYYRDNTLTDWELYGQIPHTRVEDIEIQYSSHLIRIGTHGRGVLEAPVMIGVCDDEDDADGDGICDDYDACPDFDDALLGTYCNDGDPNTYDDVYVSCNQCEGLYFLGVAEMGAQGFSIFPNPSNSTTSVHLDHWQGCELQVFDLQGRTIHTQSFSSSTIAFALVNLSPSVYLVRVTSGTGQFLADGKWLVE